MTPEEPPDATRAASTAGDLEEILGTELGQPAPVDQYHRPLADEDRAELQAELDDVEQAHAAAAAQLHTLYAD